MGSKQRGLVAPSVLFVLLCFLLRYCSMSVLITLFMFLIFCSVKSSSSQRCGPAGVIIFTMIQSFRTPPCVLIFRGSSVRSRPPLFNIAWKLFLGILRVSDPRTKGLKSCDIWESTSLMWSSSRKPTYQKISAGWINYGWARYMGLRLSTARLVYLLWLIKISHTLCSPTRMIRRDKNLLWK